MKHIRTFENYRLKKNRDEIIKEAVLQVNDIYKVNTMIDIPQSLINAYVKKVKETTGKNLRQFFGDVNIAEEIVKHVTQEYLNVDNIHAGALMGGGQTQAQGQDDFGSQAGQFQYQGQAQVQPQAPQAQGQGQAPQAQGQQAPQAQAQVQQPQAQGDAQFEDPQAQAQAPQAQAQGQFDEEDEEDEERVDFGDEDEELPI